MVAQEGVVRKTQFPRLVIPLTAVLTAFFNLGLNLVIVFVFTLAFGVSPHWTWLLFPFAVAALFVLTAAVAMGLSVLFVRFRDVAIIWIVVAQVLFYATPILYPVTTFTAEDRPHQRTPADDQPAGGDLRAGAGVGPARTGSPDAPPRRRAARSACSPRRLIFVGVCAFGVWIFNREAPRVAENL